MSNESISGEKANYPIKTVVFFGAGATVKLGMPSTDEQNKYFKQLFFGGSSKTDDLANFVNSFFTRSSFNLQSLYELIDKHIIERTSLGKYDLSQLISIRERLLCSLQEYFADREKNALKNNSAEFEKYISFFRRSAEIQISKKKRQIMQGIDMQSKEFIFSDAAYISTNWDVTLLWAMMLAHKSLNDENSNYFSDTKGIFKLKVFNDFYSYLNSKDVKPGENKDWFPYNQTVAFHINDKEHQCGKRVFLFPTFLPHGQTHWLHCSACGKLTMYIDGGFRKYSTEFIMGDNKNYKCAHCGKELGLKDSAMLLQTNYKVKAPYILEIQNSMRIALKSAQNYIFIGYSLPPDDNEYKTMFIEANDIYSGKPSNKKVYLVLYEDGWHNKFIPVKELSIDKCSSAAQTILRYTDIFGEDNVMVNLAGFPAAGESVIDLLKKQ